MKSLNPFFHGDAVAETWDRLQVEENGIYLMKIRNSISQIIGIFLKVNEEKLICTFGTWFDLLWLNQLAKTI